MTMILSPDEVCELTGRRQPKRQIQWLTENQWKFFVGADGHPKVARSYYEAHYGEPEKPKRRGVRTEGLAREAR
jgi:hypothetical protein